jgi:P4 family phage/plasmid primase-like protien
MPNSTTHIFNLEINLRRKRRNIKRKLNMQKHDENANLNARLQERCVLEVATKYKWQLLEWKSALGWGYPIFDAETGEPILNPENGKPVMRWKNFDKETQGGEKYSWLYGQNGAPPYYVLPGTKAAIEAADGLAYIAAGEIDVLTYVSAGKANTFCWLNGEGSVPQDLAEFAHKLGVTRLIYMVDRDEAGERSAQALMKRLAGTSIEVTCHRLPEYLDEKGDVNDLWISVKFDPASFDDEIDDCVTRQDRLIAPQTTMPVPSPKGAIGKQKIPTRHTGDQVDWPAERSKWIHSVVMPLIDMKAPVVKREGRVERRHCPNPQHQDNNPSYRISHDRDGDDGIPQCSCGIQHLDHPWDRNAEWVDAEPFMEWWERVRKPLFTASKANPAWGGDTNELDTEETSINTRSSLFKGLKEKPPTDDEVAMNLIEEWDGNRRFFYGQWYTYLDGVWIPEDGVRAMIWSAMTKAKEQGYRPTKGQAASIEDCLQARLRIPREQVEKGNNYINLKNGMYDLQTGGLVEHNRDLYLTYQLGFGYQPSARCPLWEHFLNQALALEDGQPDEQLIALLQEAFGYSLTNDTHFETSFWLYGPAASGKSTVIRVLQALLGTAFVSVDLNMLDHNHYQLASIPGKRVISCSEARVGSKIADSILKALISGEDILVRQIYREPFTFGPVAKVWWAMNEKPQNQDRSNAIYRRLRIIPFTNPKSSQEQDRRLIEKLVTELPGIFNWALEGLHRLYSQGDFTHAERVDEAITEYKKESDTEAEFLNDTEWCIPSAENRTQASDLYIAYKAWCDRFTHNAKSNTLVPRDWERLGLKKIKNGTIFYTGVQLTEEAAKVVVRVKSETPRR